MEHRVMGIEKQMRVEKKKRQEAAGIVRKRALALREAARRAGYRCKPWNETACMSLKAHALTSCVPLAK